ncbi:MAG: hypothetical protein WC838_05750 [Candidatus Margulisiibacteriota bacterium]|jgi:hypothetical protein
MNRKAFSLLVLALAFACYTLAAELPQASISYPAPGAVITLDATVTISGTVTGNDLKYYELSYTTDNATWIFNNILIPATVQTTINGYIGVWYTASKNITNTWKLRLRAYNNDGYCSTYYVSSVIDAIPPVVSNARFYNLTTGASNWFKTGDVLYVTANIADNNIILTENLLANLSDFGGSAQAVPVSWNSAATGEAVWRVTANIIKNGTTSFNIMAKDFGNNTSNYIGTTTADISLPTIDVYVNSKKLFSGDYFPSNISMNGTVIDNYGLVSFLLSFYSDGTLLGTTNNLSGLDLAMSFSGLNSRGLQVVAAARDIAGNISTKNIIGLSSISSYALSELLCAPNPFNPNNEVSHLGYKLSQPAIVKLSVYSLSGEKVYSTDQSGIMGYNEITWNGMGNYGQMMPNGLYLGILLAEYPDGSKQKMVTKFVVLK